jgi:hypothetical protein
MLHWDDKRYSGIAKNDSVKTKKLKENTNKGQVKTWESVHRVTGYTIAGRAKQEGGHGEVINLCS